MSTGIRSLQHLATAALLAIALAACSPPNLGSNVKGGDLEQTQKVWVSAGAPNASGRFTEWHVQTDRKPVAEFIRTLSTAKCMEAQADYRPGGDGQIVLTMPSAGQYNLWYWLAERRLWDGQTYSWYAMPEGLPDLLEQWHQLPVTRGDCCFTILAGP